MSSRGWLAFWVFPCRLSCRITRPRGCNGSAAWAGFYSPGFQTNASSNKNPATGPSHSIRSDPVHCFPNLDSATRKSISIGWHSGSMSRLCLRAVRGIFCAFSRASRSAGLQQFSPPFRRAVPARMRRTFAEARSAKLVTSRQRGSEDSYRMAAQWHLGLGQFPGWGSELLDVRAGPYRKASRSQNPDRDAIIPCCRRPLASRSANRSFHISRRCSCSLRNCAAFRFLCPAAFI